MSLKGFLACFASFACAASHTFAVEQTRPNIIFILADDFGIPGVGCYGGAHKTPNIDSLAAGGTRFEYCFAAPLCAPTRALCMTGRYGFRTGVTDNGMGANATPDKEVCIAKVLKQAGYSTAVAGKWRQLSYFNTQEDGQRWGFDEFMIWGLGGGDEEANNKKTAAGKGERYWNPAYNHNGKPVAEAEGKYGPDLLHDFVVDFIRRHRQGPFFVYYPTPLIHGPILATPDSPEGKKGKHYEDNIAYLDKLVGKLVAELDQLKLRENTLIVFVGDNGSTEIGTINGRKVDGKKSNLLEGGSRVPLIVNWPGTTPKGVVKKDLVDASDFYPTFAELAGAALPAGVKIDGHSLAAQVKGKSGSPREWAYVQLGDKKYVRDARWKLNNDGEFFNMTEAPFRQIPVSADTADAAAKAGREKLQVVLDQLVAEDNGAVAKKRKKDPEKKKERKKRKKAAKAA